MNKLNIALHCLTDKDFNPELITDLLAGVLKSVNITMTQIEMAKVSESFTLQRRAPRKSKPTTV